MNHRGFGVVFDFDFEMNVPSHKLLRTPFRFRGIEIPFRGMQVTEDCIGCGECFKKCTFKAICQNKDRYRIENSWCDVCRDCTVVCPVEAIVAVRGG